MMKVVDYIRISAPVEAVFNVVNDYEKWPEFISVNKKVNLLREKNGKRYFEVFHEEKKGKVIRSECIRKQCAPNHICFVLMNNKFRHLSGEWIVAPIDNGSLLISIHEYEVKVPLGIKFIADLIGYFVVKNMFFDKTTPVTLREIKERVESVVIKNNG